MGAEALLVEGAGDQTEQAQAGKDEWWRPLALIAFVVLLIEWIVAQRGGLTRLRLWWRTRRAAQG